jgi:hypothetical protein
VKRPQISGSRIWWNHECRVLRVFECALNLFRDEEGLDIREDGMNRKLYFCIKRANATLNKHGEGVEFPVTYEANNQPDADDEQRSRREDKRPDFQWGITDQSEEDPLLQDKFFVIECKRLGEPLRNDWVFNKNYVEKGMLRFVQGEHGYGKSAPSGAMIGYIRSMTSDDILNEVNAHATSACLHLIVLSGNGWVDEGVSRLEQQLDRPEVPPTPFSLRHLWVDLRQK